MFSERVRGERKEWLSANECHSARGSALVCVKKPTCKTLFSAEKLCFELFFTIVSQSHEQLKHCVSDEAAIELGYPTQLIATYPTFMTAQRLYIGLQGEKVVSHPA